MKKPTRNFVEFAMDLIIRLIPGPIGKFLAIVLSVIAFSVGVLVWYAWIYGLLH